MPYKNPESIRLNRQLSNTCWVAWNQELNRPIIDKYLGQESEQTIKFHEDGRCVSGTAKKFTGKWEIRETYGHPHLYVLVGHDDDDLALSVQIAEDTMTLSSSKGSKCYRKRQFGNGEV